MESLSKKIEKFGSVELVPYGELLDTTEWSNQREEIIKRDKRICSGCGLKPINEVIHEKTIPGDSSLIQKYGYFFSPHIHHKYYIINKLP